MGVATTCLAETIGDDVPAIIREFKEEEGIGDDLEKDIIIIPVSTPSYGESHVSGYIKALMPLSGSLRKSRKVRKNRKARKTARSWRSWITWKTWKL
ncbi:nitrogenase component 1 [Methanosarcina horonobensis]|uniref:nitrogenase component 1 n=1 Tax=Methanosarcina horonobensis TaxID=418008 RepID=UPI0022B904ED|nr:nitrogenase component 1 [Methanosarcina horonobensis]